MGVIGLLLLTALAAATPPAPPIAPPLSLEAALAEADRNAGVLVARAEATVQRRQIEATRAPASPVLSVGTTRYSARETLFLAQDVRWGGERTWSVRAASDAADAADSTAAGALKESRLLVRQAWFALAAAEDAEALARESEARGNDVTAAVRARTEGGRSPRLDLVRAEVDAARLAAVSEALAEGRRAAGAHLHALLGRDAATDGRTDGRRPPPLDDAALALLAKRADPGRDPAVVAQERGLAAARSELEASRRRLLPGLSFSLGVNADDPGVPGPDYQGTVSLTLPIGARGSSAVNVADARVAVAEARVVSARRQVAEAFAVAERRVRAARAQLAVLDGRALPAAEEAAALTREAFAAGRGDLLRVLDAERSLLETRSARLGAWAEEKAAEADLLAAVGEGEE